MLQNEENLEKTDMPSCFTLRAHHGETATVTFSPNLIHQRKPALLQNREPLICYGRLLGVGASKRDAHKRRVVTIGLPILKK